MYVGNVCDKHPALGGKRHNGGNCPECVKAAKQSYQHANREKILSQMAAYRQANSAAIKVMNAKWRASNKERIRLNNLRRMGFTPETFDAAITMQQGRCAICGIALSSLPTKQVHADHCHKTGMARGVLCHHCNAGLGAFRDDPSALLRAAEYLAAPTL